VVTLLYGAILSYDGVVGVLSEAVIPGFFKLKLVDGRDNIHVKFEDALIARKFALQGTEVILKGGRKARIIADSLENMYKFKSRDLLTCLVRFEHNSATQNISVKTILESVVDLYVDQSVSKKYDNDEKFLARISRGEMKNGDKHYRLVFKDGDEDLVSKLDIMREMYNEVGTLQCENYKSSNNTKRCYFQLL